MYDPEIINAYKQRPLDGDSNPVHITAIQAQKCAAILEAYIDGQTLYEDAINLVAQFLKTSALEGAFGSREFSRPSARTLWQDIEVISWPQHGGPQPQPDIE